MTQGLWQVLDEKKMFAAPPFVTVTRERVRTGRGRVIEDFYRVDLAIFALCVPQLASGEIVTLWEYKHGPRRFGLGFPAGFVEAGEAPDAACGRELMEETGYAIGSLRGLGSYFDHGNQRGSLGHYFLARDCRLAGELNADATEEAELRLMRPAAIDRALADGEFSVVHHISAWALARPHLR